MTNAYKQVFNTPAGRAVLADLDRIVNATKLDANMPNPNSALWKCAQLSLVQRIVNQLEVTE
jgi:hypothetical protein